MTDTVWKHLRHLKLFLAAELFELVAMDFLGSLPRTERGDQFVLVTTDQFSKPARFVPLRPITAIIVTNAFLDHWMYAY